MMKASAANIFLLGLCCMSLTDHGLGTSIPKNDTVVLRPKFWGKDAESIEIINPFATYMVQLEADKCLACSNCSDMEKHFTIKTHFSVQEFLAQVYKLCVDFSNAETLSCYNQIRCSFSSSCLFSCSRSSWMLMFSRMCCTDHSQFSLVLQGLEPCKLTGSVRVFLRTNADVYYLKMLNGSCGKSSAWLTRREGKVASHFGNGSFSQPCTLVLEYNYVPKTSFCFKFLYVNFPESTLSIFFSNEQHKSWKIFNRGYLPSLGSTHCGPYTNTKTLITLVPDKIETQNQHQLFFKFWYKRQTKTEIETWETGGDSFGANPFKVVLSIAGVVVFLCCTGCLSHKRRCAKPTNVLSSTHVSYNVRDNSESVRISEYVETPVAATFDSNQRTVAPPDYSTLEANDFREVPQFPTSHAAYRSPLIERQEVGEDDGPPPKYESLFPSEGSA